jgi:hypothetical protein
MVWGHARLQDGHVVAYASR